MLTGRVPFEAENAIGTVLMHINEAPTRPSEMSPGVDSRLEAVCLRALRKAPAERFADAREMRAELRAVVDSPELVPAGAPRQEMLAETTRPPRPEEATATQEAPVVAVPAAPVSRGSLDVAKPTLAGTTSAVPGPRKRARAAVVLAGAALALGVAGALVILPRGHRATAAATPAPPIENGTAAGAPSPAPGRDTPAPSMDRASAPAPTRPDSSPKPPGKGAAIAAPPGRATTSGPSAASAASAAAPPTPSATPSPAPSVAQAAPPPSAAPTASATPAAPPPDPSFDPDRGVVEIGLVNGTGVSDRPVRAALQGAGLTSCYRTALRAKGSRATAIATLNLSIDGSGAVRTAVVIGADILPGLTRCIQGAAQGQHLAASQVAPGGASAEVWLSFKVP
jgi:serine/threonine-protein kinase